jgi:hypothetical protein
MVLLFDEPKALLDEIRETFPRLKVSYFQQRSRKEVGSVPKGEFDSGKSQCLISMRLGNWECILFPPLVLYRLFPSHVLIPGLSLRLRQSCESIRWF